jgi:quercetin dioxygenase-like cupin family protein
MAAAPAIVRKALLTADMEGGRQVDRVEIKQIDFVPSQQTGLHLHVCPVVGYIARGTVLFQIEGEPPRTLKEGDAFHEPAGARILHFDNASDRDPLTFIAFYLLGDDDRELITMLE